MESQHPILKDLDQDAVFYDHSIEFGVLCLCGGLSHRGCRKILKDLLRYHLEVPLLRRLGIPQVISSQELEGRLVQHLQSLEGAGDQQLIMRDIYKELLIRRGRLLNFCEDRV